MDSVDAEDAGDAGDDLNDANAEILHRELVGWREDITAATDTLLDEAMERGLVLERMNEQLNDLKALLQRFADK